MSEVKGTLLVIVLAVAVFGVVFGIISLAMKRSAESVANRMDEAAHLQAEFDDEDENQGQNQGQVVVITLP